mmetsp:Transcript_32993/g.91007  ORF Transcript_32993/g.91007 Transcript_32993/m.91007 type:complete len:204 (+) Transcript_32993:307-918(+)
MPAILSPSLQPRSSIFRIISSAAARPARFAEPKASRRMPSLLSDTSRWCSSMAAAIPCNRSAMRTRRLSSSSRVPSMLPRSSPTRLAVSPCASPNCWRRRLQRSTSLSTLSERCLAHCGSEVVSRRNDACISCSCSCTSCLCSANSCQFARRRDSTWQSCSSHFCCLPGAVGPSAAAADIARRPVDIAPATARASQSQAGHAA